MKNGVSGRDPALRVARRAQLTARYAVFLPSTKAIEAGRLSHSRQCNRLSKIPGRHVRV
jgi:hypothetical protein